MMDRYHLLECAVAGNLLPNVGKAECQHMTVAHCKLSANSSRPNCPPHSARDLRSITGDEATTGTV